MENPRGLSAETDGHGKPTRPTAEKTLNSHQMLCFPFSKWIILWSCGHQILQFFCTLLLLIFSCVCYYPWVWF